MRSGEKDDYPSVVRTPAAPENDLAPLQVEQGSLSESESDREGRRCGSGKKFSQRDGSLAASHFK